MKKHLLFLLFIIASITVNAQYYEWVGGDGGPNGWGDPNNWENEFGEPGLPGYGADIHIGGNGAFVYYDPQFVDLFNSITIYDNATVLATDPIVVISDFSLEEFSSVNLQIDDINQPFDGFIEVINGTYNIDGNIVPIFVGNSFVPQIGDEITVATATSSASTCGIFNIGNAVATDNGISIYEVAYLVECISPNEIIINITDINYTGGKAWDGEAGNGLWSSPANWDPNGVPTPDDWVIINKNGGTSVIAGSISQDRLTIGNNNSLTATGNIEISHVLKVSETASLNWSSGTLKKRVEGDFPTITNLGTLTVNGITIVDTGTITNNQSGLIEMNGNININDGRVFNFNGAKININGDNLTIGYTSGSLHRLYNAGNGIIEKTMASGSGTSNINLTQFDNLYGGILRSEQGTLAIGENLVNTGGIITGSGQFSLPNDFINDGVISPGSSPGILSVVGNLTTTQAADFNIEIDGTTAGTEYDQISVTGEAILEGTLNVTLGYLPANDASYEIVTAGILTSCNFPAQITSNYNGTDYTFDVICLNNKLYLNGPGATLNTSNFDITELKVYPNPTNGKVTLKLAKSILELQVTISNILGQVITNERFVNTNTVDLTIDGSPGIYFLTLKAAEGSKKTLKIIKN